MKYFFAFTQLELVVTTVLYWIFINITHVAMFGIFAMSFAFKKF